ncbi:MAG: iron-containing redox enzyme family protein [Cyanobacteria bacterium P01_A01_bin.114]
MNTATQALASIPLFKDRVVLTFKDSEVEIRYGEQGFAIAVPPEDRPDLDQLLRRLQVGGQSPAQLAQACPRLQAQIPELLQEFERRGLLIQAESLTHPAETCLTGRQFYSVLSRFLERLKRRFPPSPFSQQMAAGSLSRQHIIGYALEAYHVTHLCPRLLAPALAHQESSTTQALLQSFFVSELHHDCLIEKSLSSVGIEGDQLKQMQPLPTTFSICAALGLFAQQHPLSFKAALMLFEEDEPEFYGLFTQQCETLGLPADFYNPILRHAQINDEGAHDQITAALMAEIPYVSQADQQRVKKNMALLMEGMILRTYEILEYYGQAKAVIPRCFGQA